MSVFDKRDTDVSSTSDRCPDAGPFEMLRECKSFGADGTAHSRACMLVFDLCSSTNRLTAFHRNIERERRNEESHQRASRSISAVRLLNLSAMNDVLYHL